MIDCLSYFIYFFLIEENEMGNVFFLIVVNIYGIMEYLFYFCGRFVFLFNERCFCFIFFSKLSKLVYNVLYVCL